jgi:hypothetical protein
MQVLCMLTFDDNADVECPCCRQKYAVYYSRHDNVECEQALEAVRAALEAHHQRSRLPTAHPGEAFNVPPWHGHAHASGAALLSGAPIRPPARRSHLTLVPSTQQRRVS